MNNCKNCGGSGYISIPITHPSNPILDSWDSSPCNCRYELKKETMSDDNKENKEDKEDKGPSNPISVLLEAAISMHELYVSFVAAGFTEAQALTLVAQTLRPQQPN